MAMLVYSTDWLAYKLIGNLAIPCRFGICDFAWGERSLGKGRKVEGTVAPVPGGNRSSWDFLYGCCCSEYGQHMKNMVKVILPTTPI